jgi:hypothetical protein
MLPLLLSLLCSQVPDSGTRHDRRLTFVELGISANTGIPEAFKLQAELALKRRRWPVFVSGRAGVGFGTWLGQSTLSGSGQVALHYTDNGDDSWSLKAGMATGERFGAIPECDEPTDSTRDGACGYLESNLSAVFVGLERTAYFSWARDLAWRVSASIGYANHRYTWHGRRVEEEDEGLLPLLELGVLWTPL